ncbi:MAG: hypothetical protein FJX11_17265 [Alphaproteobacteria bacterium]|nr:hypothetical protein [Alphaproteobacteria bacterium]
MKRRTFLAGSGGVVAWPSLARAQKVPRVGYVVAGDPEPGWTLFRKAMADLGYVQGRSITYEYAAIGGDAANADALVAPLVRRPVDLIVAVFTPAIAAARRATTTIPIVFSGGGALDTGMLRNIARPEANLTGVFNPAAALAGKAIELFREIKPATRLLGVVANQPDPFHVVMMGAVEAAAKAGKFDVAPVFIRSADELGPAIDMLAARRVDGVLVQPSVGLQAAAVNAMRHRLPAFSFRRGIAESGGLFSYSPDNAEVTRILAGYVDKVLKGTRIADLPAQELAHFELVVNLKTARTLGLTPSAMFLNRADEVIE